MTKRVQLHEPALTDERDYREAVRNSDDLLHPWIWLTDTKEAFVAYVERAQREDQRSYLVREIETNQLVGFVNANNIVRGAFHSTFLGYGAFSGAEGRGIMTEALTLAISDLFHNEELHRVEANIQPKNTRSIALVQRLGFRKEGYSPDYLFIDGKWRDHERWALTTEMWTRL